MESPDVLEIEHLNMAYRGSAALSDVSLRLKAGEIQVLLGEDGAGKTTLLKILGGLVPPGAYQGEIRVDGQPVTLRTPKDSIRGRIGIVPRRPAVFAGLSMVENIVIGNWETNRSFLRNTMAARRQAEATLHRAGITLDLDGRVADLTDGQKRLVMLARSLSMGPRLLVLDEPAAFVANAGEMSQLIRILRTLAGQGLASLYLARNVREAMDVADRITILRDGSIVETVERAHFDQTALMLAMMSQHPERSAGPEEDEAAGGLLGSLRSIFDYRGRR
jgi:ABC-type sugar transport system ATPase subunit